MNFNPNAPIDLDAISKRGAETSFAYLKMALLRQPGQEIDPADGAALMKNFIEVLKDNAVLTGEVKRLREQRQKARDIHTPINSGDPAAPGAVCGGCSVYGARVMWPCPTWKATEDERPAAFNGLL